MKFLLDTDWIVSYLNGRPEAVAFVNGLLDQGLALSVINYGETREGLLAAHGFEERLGPLDRLVSLADVLQIDVTIASTYAQIRLDLRSQGQLIPDNDLWIAATALAHDLTLVTRDKHFERVPGLKLHLQVR